MQSQLSTLTRDVKESRDWKFFSISRNEFLEFREFESRRYGIKRAFSFAELDMDCDVQLKSIGANKQLHGRQYPVLVVCEESYVPHATYHEGSVPEQVTVSRGTVQDRDVVTTGDDKK